MHYSPEQACWGAPQDRYLRERLPASAFAVVANSLVPLLMIGFVYRNVRGWLDNLLRTRRPATSQLTDCGRADPTPNVVRAF